MPGLFVLEVGICVHPQAINTTSGDVEPIQLVKQIPQLYIERYM